MVGPEGLSLMLYDDPELVREMMAWRREMVRRNWAPVIERLRPEIIELSEDLCYKNGMLLSPGQFEEFFGSFYDEVHALAQAGGVDVLAVDSDGNVMEFADLAVAHGVNCLYPCEVKAGNDLFELRRRHPRLILCGWLEKEVVNEGNEDRIEPELRAKVPPLLEAGGYLPNLDHGLQPMATFANICQLLSLLHEMTGNPTGAFPRTGA